MNRCLLLLSILIYSQAGLTFDWQGHRGARGLYPENTIGSMEEALKYPINTLELDVVISKDNKIIVSHEPWMSGEICVDPEGNRFNSKKYNIFKMTYEDITKFNCGSVTHPRFPGQIKVSTGKPTLEKLLKVTEEKLKELNRKNVSYNIEIKSSPENEKLGFQPDFESFSDIVIKFLKDKLPLSRFTIQSFDWRVLKYIHKTYPDVRLVALKEGSVTPAEDLKQLGFNPTVYSPYFKFLEKKDVEFFHEKKIKVIPWTVNDISEMEALIQMGVDGIITDFPNKIQNVGNKNCREGYNLFEGECVKVPAHAVPYHKNPGWMCKSGYIQKRSKCTKVKVPEHGHLLPNGKTWACDEGYVRYRGTCKKR